MTEHDVEVFFSKEELNFLHILVLDKIARIGEGDIRVYHHGTKEGGDAILKIINNKLERILI